MMTEEYTDQFNQFIRSVDDKIIEFINLKDNKLTEHLSSIHDELWYNYKRLTGTSAGFYGIDEHIVFSAFKCFIEALNDNQEFECKILTPDLCSFELEKNNKKLTIYRSSRLNHIPVEARNQLFKDGFKLRAPDIVILKEDSDVYTMVAAIEIKNYLDKVATNSAIEMLSQIREGRKTSKGDHAKYAIFSFNNIFVKEETAKKLRDFLDNENNRLIINERGFRKAFETVDLLQFFNCIQKEIQL